MSFTVHLQRLSSAPGVRLPFLLDDRGVPVQEVLRWVVRERLFRVDWTSIRNEVRSLALFYSWAEESGVDLAARISGAFEISPAEIKAFVRWLRIRPARDTEGCVKGSTVNSHLKPVAAYCAWATRYRAEFSTSPQEASKAAFEESRLVSKFSREHVHPGIKAEHEGLPPADRARLLAILDPMHPANPFSDETAFHVQVMLTLILETGMRLGEAACLQVADLHLHGGSPTVFVIKRDNIEDPRLDAPAVKTLEREIPISTRLALMLVQYERRVRGRARHPFFLVSPRFRTPVGMRQVERVCEKLRAALGIEEFSPHTLRRTFSDMFYAAVKEMGWNEEDGRRFHTVICGWSDLSKMPDLYARREIRENAFQTLRHHQGTLYNTAPASNAAVAI